MTPEKLCVFCAHFRWAEIEYRYYSTLTGGDMLGGMTCLKQRLNEGWPLRPDTTEEFREAILTAEGCPDYDVLALQGT